MNQDDIFDEIRDIFKCPMKTKQDVKFTVLQLTGGGNKTLTIPAVSKSFEWTAASIAGKNSKTPVHTLANEELKAC